MSAQTGSVSIKKEEGKAKESQPAPSNPRPPRRSSDPIAVNEVTITHGNHIFSVGANSYIPINHFLPQVVRYFTENIQRGGDDIDYRSYQLVAADGRPPSRNDQTLGEMLTEMNRRQPMNPPILRILSFFKHVIRALF